MGVKKACIPFFGLVVYFRSFLEKILFCFKIGLKIHSFKISLSSKNKLHLLDLPV